MFSLSFIGLIAIVAVVALLISKKVSPIVAFTLIPIIAAVVAGFDLDDISGFFSVGVNDVISVAVMFIFAILFFGIMQDAGLFDPVINKVLALSKGNVIGVAVATVIVACVAHLDGSGATTFLLTVPALLPTYKRLQMSPYLLLLLIGLGASIMNMVPWAGPVARVGTVLNMSAGELWLPLIPLQIVGIVFLLGLAVLLALREKKRIANRHVWNEAAATAYAANASKGKESQKKAGALQMTVNALLMAAVIIVLVVDVLPSPLVFMLGVALALPFNLRKVDDQMEAIKRHAPNALMMATIIIAAGCFLGILNESGMLRALAVDIVGVLPHAVVPYLHVIIGFFGVPFDLILSTDAYYFALLPLVEQIVTEVGVSSTSAAYALVIGNIIGTFVSPLAPAVWLALQLAGLEMGKHIRYSFFIMWGFSIIMLVSAYLLGIITFT